MDTYRSNQDKEKDFDDGYAYQPEASAASAQSKLANGNFGYNLLKALRLSSQTQAAQPAPAEIENGAEFAGFVKPGPSRSYIDQTPVYKGEYKNLSPLYFNTEPVD